MGDGGMLLFMQGGEDAGETVKLSQISDHQNELIAELSAYREQHAGLTEVLGSTGLLQETLWRQKQELIRKLKELSHQKAQLELNLREIEDKLKNQEEQLLLQKLSLESEIRSRDLHVRHWQLQAEVNKVHQSPCVLSVSDQERLDELRSQLEQTHEEAVTRLKKHLSGHFTLREAELQKQFSGQLSAVRRQHADQLEALSTHIQSKLHQLDDDVVSLVDGGSYTNGDSVTNQLRKQEVTGIIHRLQTELKAVLEQHLALLEQQHLQDSSTDKVKQDKTDHLKNMADEVEEETAMEANSSINVLSKVKHLLLREYTSALKVLVSGWHTGLKERLQGVSDDLKEAWCREESARKTRDMAEIAQSHNALAELLHIRGKMVSQLKALEHEAVEFHRNSVMRLHSELQGEHEQVVDRVEQMKNSVAEGATIATLQAQLDRMTQEARRFQSDTPGMAELRKELEIKHAKEMEELRRYFEQKCADVEKRYSEEVFSQHSRKLSGSSASSAEELVSDMYYGGGDHGQQKLPPITHICETFTGEPNYKSERFNEALLCIAATPIHGTPLLSLLTHSPVTRLCRDLEERYKADFDKRLLEYHSKLEEAKVDLEEKYQGEMMTLKKHYEAKVEQLVNDLAQSHHAELGSLQEKHNKEISNRVDQIQGEHNQELQSLRKSLHEECARKLTELRDKHAEETQELKISYQQDLDDKVHELQRRNAAELEAVKARCEKGLCQRHDLSNSKDKLRGDTLSAHHQEELKILEDSQAEKRTEELCGTNSEAPIVGIDTEEKVHEENRQELEAVRARICEDKSTETCQRAVPQPVQGQDFATVLRMFGQWCSDNSVAGFVDQLQVLHNEEIKTLEDSFVEKEHRVEAQFDQRIHEQTEQVRCEVVAALHQYIQLLMSDSSVNTPLELALLEQRFTAPLHAEIATLKQELATLQVQQSQTLKLNQDSDMEDAFKERLTMCPFHCVRSKLTIYHVLQPMMCMWGHG
ncbi:unnamed protein product [Timema podura]|uniref:Pericentrin n=1 Tax=Timema podura TaxID=61482 RepID=A0ABN7NBX5_TIMPD|nr:unnamed protein product [Timema podura]